MRTNRKILQKNLEIESLNNPSHPRCFDNKKQYQEWLMHEKVVHTLAFRKNICEDCTNSYQKRMINEKRCANPRFLVQK